MKYFVLVALGLIACGPEPTDSGPQTTTTTTTSDVGQEIEDGADEVASGSFTCGAAGLVCDAGQMCVGMGQGACVGPPPDANGACEPNCAPVFCGDSEKCLCNSYRCDAAPSGCTTCGCAAASPNLSFCACEDEGGELRLDCPGA